MGKAGRWLRSFLTGGKKDRKGKDGGQPSSLSSPAAVPAPPSAKEKRRWSFRRPPAAATNTSSLCFSDVQAVVQQHDQLAAVAASPAPPEAERSTAGDVAAAVRIQAAFRSYLARKALCALRGMVKLQAMVRGQLVRRQASMTLRRMQALVAAQRRARAERLRLLDEDKDKDRDKHARSPRPPTSRRSSPQHHRSRKPLEVVDRGSEENVRVVEVDNGGGGAVRGCGRRSTCGSAPPAKAELYQKVSPTPSALTDASARTMSGRLDDYSFSAAASEASGRHHRVAAAAAATGGDHAAALQQLFPKNYMSNTESSRAKARSQSAPRQRHDQASAAASPSPSPSCGEWTTPGDRRRRASLDPRDLAAAGVGGVGGVGARMERCASQARASASAACPWAVRLDRSTASLAGSDCGSSATVVTAATAARVTS